MQKIVYMHLLVLAEEDVREEFLKKKITDDTRITFVSNLSGMENIEHDALFIVTEVDLKKLASLTSKPVFINSTITPLKELDLPKNFARFIGWSTFLKRETWEIATNNDSNLDVLKKLEWNYILVADEPGFVSAITIAMIINEAYYALGENVSTKEEIDLAMKLGTNYPFGPFEWSVKIGLQNIYSLLKKLNENDNRYKIAPCLEREVNKNAT